jgi:hypothetical protein
MALAVKRAPGSDDAEKEGAAPRRPGKSKGLTPAFYTADGGSATAGADQGACNSWHRYEAALFASALYDHGVGDVRFLTLAMDGSAYDQHVSADRAAWAARDLAGGRDTYIALNPVRYRGGPVAGIRAIAVDLDYYKVAGWSGCDPRYVLAAVLEHLVAAGVPGPPLAVSTGRGLQLAWLVTPTKNRAAPKARATMRGLVRLLVSFGADPACTDLTRVFRLPGTVNSKNGAVARLLVHEPVRHDFDDLCVAILGESKPCCADTSSAGRSQPHRRAMQSKKDRVAPHQTNKPPTSGRSFARQRVADLQRLIRGRWGGRVPAGARNVVAHLATVHLLQLGRDPSEWCERWLDGHDPKELARTVKTATRRPYRYRNRTIGELLEVTADEVTRYGLKSISASGETVEEVKQRRQERKALAERERRLKAGARPHAASARRRQPWVALGISRSTYYTRRKAARTNSWPLTLRLTSTLLAGTAVVATVSPPHLAGVVVGAVSGGRAASAPSLTVTTGPAYSAGRTPPAARFISSSRCWRGPARCRVQNTKARPATRAPFTSTDNTTRTITKPRQLNRCDGLCRGDRADVAVDLPPVLEKTHGVNCGCPLLVSDQAFELLHRLLRCQGDDLGRQPDRGRTIVLTSKSNELCLKRHSLSSIMERHLRSGRLKIRAGAPCSADARRQRNGGGAP